MFSHLVSHSGFKTFPSVTCL